MKITRKERAKKKDELEESNAGKEMFWLWRI